MTRITDDELARQITRVMERDKEQPGNFFRDPWSVADLADTVTVPTSYPRILRRLRALRDEGRVVEVAGPRGSLWRLP